MEETKDYVQPAAEQEAGEDTDEVIKDVYWGEDHVEVRKPINKKIFIIPLVILFVTLLLALAVILKIHFDKVSYYENHFFPNTYINNVECGEFSAAEVAEILNSQIENYELEIKGRDKAGNTVVLGVIRANDIDLQLEDVWGAVRDILAQQDETQWYQLTDGEEYSYSVVQGVKFDEELLRELVENLSACQPQNMIAPADAYIREFSQETGTYVIVPEVKGTQLNTDAVMECVAAAIYGNGDTVDLEEQGCYAEPKITSESEEITATVDTINTWLATNINYSWNTFEVILDTDVIKQWVSINNGDPVLDEAAVAAFVDANADKYDTYGKKRNFMTTLGVELSLPSGAFGWRTDREAETAELIALIKQGTVTDREPVYSHTAPWKGMNDIGNSYVEADLTNQHLYLYSKGQLVLESDFVSGDMNVPGNITPQGVFGITYKTTNVVLRGADYETPVTYWMPYHGNFGMHDASWRTEFGGDIYLTDGSHGCLNLPVDKAAEIYNYMREGFPVICYYY